MLATGELVQLGVASRPLAAGSGDGFVVVAKYLGAQL